MIHSSKICKQCSWVKSWKGWSKSRECKQTQG